MYVLFAFANIDRFVAALQQLRQPIEHQADALDVPDPPALAVRPPLPEALRVHADGLIEEPAAFIGVIVGRHDAPAFRSAPVVAACGLRPPHDTENRCFSGIETRREKFLFECENIASAPAG